IFSIWLYRNGTVRSRTTRWRGAHSRSVSVTAVNATGRWLVVSGCVRAIMMLLENVGGSARRGAAGLAHHQPAWKAFDARRTGPSHHGERAQPRLPAELVQVHVDRGDGRPGCRGNDVPVVETDHGHVVGHTNAHLAQGIDDATRDLVAAAEDRVDPG